MSLNAYAQLTANGNPLTGDTSTSSVGGTDVSTDHIELFAVDWGSYVDTSESTTTRTRSTRVREPLRLMKRVDQTTPLFFQALRESQAIAGKIKFFDMGDDGTARHRFTLTISKSRIISVRGQLRDTLDPANNARPVLEIIEIQPGSITYTDEVYSTQYADI